jgi:hypothetical protein
MNSYIQSMIIIIHKYIYIYIYVYVCIPMIIMTYEANNHNNLPSSVSHSLITVFIFVIKVINDDFGILE